MISDVTGTGPGPWLRLLIPAFNSIPAKFREFNNFNDNNNDLNLMMIFNRRRLSLIKFKFKFNRKYCGRRAPGPGPLELIKLIIESIEFELNCINEVQLGIELEFVTL